MKKTKNLNDFTKNVAIALLLVAVMLFVAAKIPASTFAAPEPYNGEVYANYATYTAPAGYVSHDYSLDARDVIDDLTHDSTWGAWNFNKEYVLNDIDEAAKIFNIIKDRATFSGMYASEHIPEKYDLLIATPSQSVYITFPLDEVTVNTRGAGLVYKLPVEATLDIMDIYASSRGVDLGSKCPLVNAEYGADILVCDSEFICVDISAEDIQRMATLVNGGYSYSHQLDCYDIVDYDFVMVDNTLGQRVYVNYSKGELMVVDFCNPAYVCTLNSMVMDELMSVYSNANVRYLEDIVLNADNASCYSSEWEGGKYSYVDAKMVRDLIVPSAVSDGDENYMPYPDMELFFIYNYEDVIVEENFRVSTEGKVVELLVSYIYEDYTNTEYHGIFDIPDDVVQQVIRCCGENAVPTTPSVVLTDEIISHISWLEAKDDFRTGAIRTADVYNVLYEVGNYYQSAMELSVAISASSLASERALSYIGLAMKAQTWDEMKANLVIAVEDYAVSVFNNCESRFSDSFAVKMISESFRANLNHLSTMEIVRYALWISVVTGGCCC